VSDPIGDRMKRYERAAKTALTWRLPVIVRIDGRAFHTYTKGCERPFDERLIDGMNACAMAVCEEAQGAAIAYVQSDEISVLLHGYRRLDSQPWFDNEVQKIVSISASIAAAEMTLYSMSIFGRPKIAHFDARVFTLPDAEVCNYFIWRQQDATRNAIQMAASAHYSHRELHRKNTSEMQEMLFAKGVNFNDLSTHHKRGRCILRETYQHDGAERHRWIVDREPPIFTKDRDYIERHLAVESEES
jgi:tRNA(His) guanylyltransferase